MIWPRALAMIRRSESPCIKICKLDFETRLCVGCRRSAAEIAGWDRYSELRKRRILSDLKDRT